jgi:hypothetical protein
MTKFYQKGKGQKQKGGAHYIMGAEKRVDRNVKKLLNLFG